MNFFGGNQPGDWMVESKSDSRWDSGWQRAKDITLSSGICQEMRDFISKCEKEYGEKPTDLKVSAWKD